MICYIFGMVCSIDNENQTRDGQHDPIVTVFSGDEAVKIHGFTANPSDIGHTIEVFCEVKQRTYEGRAYITIRAIPDEQKGGKSK